MSDIETTQLWVRDHLASRVSLRLVRFVEENDQTLEGKVKKALAELGIAGIIGSIAGANSAPDSKLIEMDLSFGVRVKETVPINRDKRIVACTVADEDERLHLISGAASVSNLVHQEDVDKDYVLLASALTDPDSWAEHLTATQALELIIRALHFQHPTRSTTIVFTGFDEHNSPSDAQANFDVRVNLDPSEVT